MCTLLMIGDVLKVPKTLETMLSGDTVQPVELGDILESNDVEDLQEYLGSIEYDKLYVLYDSPSQALDTIKNSSINVDAYFTCI